MARAFRVTPLVLATALWLGIASAGQKAVVWPGADWPRATPESEGLARDAFDGLDREIKAGAYGSVDRVFVTIHGRVVADLSYPRDYREISRGRVSPIGCGEGCADAAQMHHYNYLHPRWHPFYEGRPVHTLQSVTKSVPPRSSARNSTDRLSRSTSRARFHRHTPIRP